MLYFLEGQASLISHCVEYFGYSMDKRRLPHTAVVATTQQRRSRLGVRDPWVLVHGVFGGVSVTWGPRDICTTYVAWVIFDALLMVGLV